MTRLSVLGLFAVAACASGSGPDLPSGAASTYYPVIAGCPITADPLVGAPFAIPSHPREAVSYTPTVGARGGFDIELTLPAGLEAGKYGRHAWLTGGESMSFAVRTTGGTMTGAVLVDGVQATVSVGGNTLRHFAVDDLGVEVRLVDALPRGASLVTVIAWTEGSAGLLVGRSVLALRDASTFATRLPVAATDSSVGDRMILDGSTGAPILPGDVIDAGVGTLAVRPCVGEPEILYPAETCPGSGRSYLVLALVDGEQAPLGPDSPTLRFAAPAGEITEETLPLELPQDGYHHEVLLLQIGGIGGYAQTPDGKPDPYFGVPLEVGRFQVSG